MDKLLSINVIVGNRIKTSGRRFLKKVPLPLVDRKQPGNYRGSLIEGEKRNY